MATILVVDDEAPIRQVLRRFLVRERHTVLEAEDGVAALALLDNQRADIAFVDLMMPRMGGVELMRQMKIGHKDVAVIVISAFEEMIELAVQNKVVVATLKKPFELADLAAALRKALKDIEC